MSISTYAELETACENWIHRSDLTDRIPEFITIGEARIGREVRARQMEQRVSTTPTTQYVALPSDYVAMRGVRLQGGEIGWYEYITPEIMFATFASSVASTSKKYTIFGDELIFPMTPSGTLELWYYKKLEALSTSTNTLFTSNPDLYLYAALAAAVPFIDKPDNKILRAESMFQNVKDSINKVSKEGRYPAGMAVKVG